MNTETATNKDELIAAFREAEAMLNECGSVTMFFGDGNKSWQCEEVTVEELRTTQQQKALEVFCRKVAEKFNDAGISVVALLTRRSKVEVDWTQESVKLLIWHRIQEALTGKKSSTKISPKEVQEIYETINARILAEENVYVPWPSRFNRGEAA